MKNYFLLPMIIVFAFLTSCTKEEITNITNEQVVQGAYYNETRIENQRTQVLEGISTKVGEIVFDAQEIELSRIKIGLEFNNDDITDDYIDSISLEKIEDEIVVESNLYISYLYNDSDDDFETTWEPIVGNEMLQPLQRYAIIINPKSVFPSDATVEFDIRITLIDYFGDNEYLSGNDIVGNMDVLFFQKN